MTMIDTSDSRFPKAVAIADQAGQWLKCHTRDGQKAYGIRSSRDAGRVYLVTRATCTCPDAERRPGQLCKHRLAVQIHCARVAGKPMPASDTVDGLEQMAQDRGVLDMVRHPDGEISWTRHEHASGETVYLPDHAALAQRYDDIWARFDDGHPRPAPTAAELFKRL